MAYLLDLLFPGLGHLAARRRLSGLFLLALWAIAQTAVLVTISFQVWALLAFPVVQGVLALIAVADLFRVRRQRHPEHRPSMLRSLVFLLLGPVIGAVLVFTVTQVLVRPVRIRSGSMTPSVVTGDIILVQLFAPRFWGVHLGDIVLVEHPQQHRLLIKRVLGLAGDLITIRGGVLQRNGHPLSECQLRSLRDHETGQQVIERLEVLDQHPYLVWDQPSVRSLALTVRVPEGHLFVVGDNRDRSGDSRTFGTVPLSTVHGLVSARVVPVLTNRVYEAPQSARRRAFQLCSNRTSSRTNDQNSR